MWVTTAFLWSRRHCPENANIILVKHMPILEIRTISLKPGTRNEFHRIYIEEALPLLQRWNLDVVAITAGTEVRRLSA